MSANDNVFTLALKGIFIIIVVVLVVALLASLLGDLFSALFNSEAFVALTWLLMGFIIFIVIVFFFTFAPKGDNSW